MDVLRIAGVLAGVYDLDGQIGKSPTLCHVVGVFANSICRVTLCARYYLISSRASRSPDRTRPVTLSIHHEGFEQVMPPPKFCPMSGGVGKGRGARTRTISYLGNYKNCQPANLLTAPK